MLARGFFRVGMVVCGGYLEEITAEGLSVELALVRSLDLPWLPSLGFVQSSLTCFFGCNDFGLEPSSLHGGCEDCIHAASVWTIS